MAIDASGLVNLHQDSSYEKARTGTTDSGAFIGGKYIELGFAKEEGVGKMMVDDDKPSNFHGRKSGLSGIGLLSNAGGFDVEDTADSLSIDYVLPEEGSQEEGFYLGYYKDGKETSCKNCGSKVTVRTRGTQAIADVEAGRKDIKASMQHTLGAEDTFFRTDVRLENTGTDKIKKVRYMRALNPEITVDHGGKKVTKVVRGETCSKCDGDRSVSAVSTGKDEYYTAASDQPGRIVMHSQDSRAVASFGQDKTEPDSPYDDEVYDKPPTANEAFTKDTFISMTFDVGDLDAGKSTSFTYWTSLGTYSVASMLNTISDNSDKRGFCDEHSCPSTHVKMDPLFVSCEDKECEVKECCDEREVCSDFACDKLGDWILKEEHGSARCIGKKCVEEEESEDLEKCCDAECTSFEEEDCPTERESNVCKVYDGSCDLACEVQSKDDCPTEREDPCVVEDDKCKSKASCDDSFKCGKDDDGKATVLKDSWDLYCNATKCENSECCGTADKCPEKEEDSNCGDDMEWLKDKAGDKCKRTVCADEECCDTSNALIQSYNADDAQAPENDAGEVMGWIAAAGHKKRQNPKQSHRHRKKKTKSGQQDAVGMEYFKEMLGFNERMKEALNSKEKTVTNTSRAGHRNSARVVDGVQEEAKTDTNINYNAARSGSTSGGAFIGGKYIELGIRKKQTYASHSEYGGFGQLGAYDKPSNFHGRKSGTVSNTCTHWLQRYPYWLWWCYTNGWGGFEIHWQWLRWWGWDSGPPNYPGPGRRGIGMVTNPQGFASGHKDATIDWILPWPAEGFHIGYSRGACQNCADPASIKSWTEGNNAKAEVVATHGHLKVTQEYTLGVNDKFWRTDVTMKNTGGGTLSDVRYMRSGNFWSTYDQNGHWTKFLKTHSAKTSQAPGGKAVMAESVQVHCHPWWWWCKEDKYYKAIGKNARLLYYTKDEKARVSYGNNWWTDGWLQPAGLWTNRVYDGAPTPGSDGGMTTYFWVSMAFKEGSLAPGASSTFTFWTALDSNHVDDGIKAIQARDNVPQGFCKDLPGGCGTGWTEKEEPPVICKGDPCKKDECCDPLGMCGSFSCANQGSWMQKHSADSSFCKRPKCKADDTPKCCEETCGSMTKTDCDTTRPGNTCEVFKGDCRLACKATVEENCKRYCVWESNKCQERGICDRTFSCTGGKVQKLEYPNFCSGTVCTTADCCGTPGVCPTKSELICISGTQPKEDPEYSSKVCKRTECTEEECCHLREYDDRCAPGSDCRSTQTTTPFGGFGMMGGLASSTTKASFVQQPHTTTVAPAIQLPKSPIAQVEGAGVQVPYTPLARSEGSMP